jgi:hypothetical protein
MIEMTLDAREAILFIETIARQVPYATSKALNRVALKAQARQRHHQERVMEIRQHQYFRHAVKIPKGGFATRDHLVATMLIDPKGRPDPNEKMDIFQRQEFGGTRRPVRGRKRLTLPTKEVKRTLKGVVKRPERPKNLKRIFFVQFKSGAVGLFRRIGKRQRAYTKVPAGARYSLKNDPNVVYMYFLIDKAQITAVYDFYENADVSFRANWPRAIEEELIKAFRTAKVRGFKG